jgi:hypothetical protein
MQQQQQHGNVNVKFRTKRIISYCKTTQINKIFHEDYTDINCNLMRNIYKESPKNLQSSYLLV